MKITRKQIRQIIAEAYFQAESQAVTSEGFRFSGNRFGFMGVGFGNEMNTYNPYKKDRGQN